MRKINERLNESSDWGIVLLRLIIGIVFVMHGGQKLFQYGIPGVAGVMEQIGLPLPYVSAILATATELLGGIALIVGFGTRFAAVGLAFTMVVATFAVHFQGGFFLPNGVEYVLTLLVASVALVLTGSGPLSLDAQLSGRKTILEMEGAQA